MNPYVFIVGCPRSGTTLLQRIVNAHPKITITPETHWLPRLYKQQRGLTAEGYVTDEIVTIVLEDPRFHKLNLSPENIQDILAPKRTIGYADFVSAIFDLYAARQGKVLAGDKTPGYARDIPILHELWPAAKFVHLIRDGRDVCLSLMEWRKTQKLAERFSTWNQHPVPTSALWWEWHVRLAREAGAALGSDQYYEIRYEELVAHPEEESRKLCEFFHLEADHSMLRFHEGKSKPDGHRDAKHDWLPITPGLRNWKLQMPPAQVESFEAAAGPLLEDLGYDRAFPKPEKQIQERALLVQETFIQDIRSRTKLLLPQAW